MRRATFFLALLILATPGYSFAQELTLRTVLARSAAYVSDFSRRVAGVVAEETYIQNAEAAAGARAPGVSHRELKSDFMLVQLPGQYHFVEFRDVFEVDGRPVRDRQDRLTNLFLHPGPTGPHPESIVAESARYNIGRVERTMNTPMLPLLFLGRDVQQRFEFKRTDETRPATVTAGELSDGHFKVTAEVWVVEFQEKARGTVIRTPKGKDLPARGRFWIDPESGRVLMSELATDDTNVVATIDVSYQSEPLPNLAGLSVPAEMRERYELAPDGMIVTGTATYGRFRQFGVQTNEEIDAPADAKK